MITKANGIILSDYGTDLDRHIDKFELEFFTATAELSDYTEPVRGTSYLVLRPADVIPAEMNVQDVRKELTGILGVTWPLSWGGMIQLESSVPDESIATVVPIYDHGAVYLGDVSGASTMGGPIPAQIEDERGGRVTMYNTAGHEARFDDIRVFETIPGGVRMRQGPTTDIYVYPLEEGISRIDHEHRDARGMMSCAPPPPRINKKPRKSWFG